MIQVPLSDIDFYERKIRRLQSDLANFQEELTNARLRLRTAEDFQIKYELLLQKSQQENDRLKNEERELADKHHELLSLKISENDKQWNDRLEKAEEELGNQHKENYNRLKQEFDQFKLKHDKCGNKSEEWDLLNFKNRKLQRQNEILEQKIELLKRDSENNRSEEVNSMKENLMQKNKERLESERKLYRDQIQQLQLKIRSLEEEIKDALIKADPKRQKEIDKLKEQVEERARQANKQLSNIGDLLKEKNIKIQQLLGDRFKVQEDLLKEKKELRAYIKRLEDKLYEKEKEHQKQLLNLKERMSKIREEEAEELKKQINKNQDNFQNQRKIWDTILQDKDKEMERVKRKAQEEAIRHKEDKQSKLSKIQQLRERLKQFEGEKHAGQTQKMINSLRDIQNKEADFCNYENGVTFLDRQLKKATLKIQQKNLQVSRLVKELNELRSDTEKELDEMRNKYKKEKKYYNDKINNLQAEVRDLNETVRYKDKEIKRRDKDTQSQAFKLKAENKALKDISEQMQRDYNRLIDNKKNVQKNFREQREKGLTSKTDLTMAKKQKWLQLQRQKNEMEVVFKEKEERLKTQFQIEREKLRHQRDKYRHENELQRALIEDLKKGQTGSDEEDKYAQFNKKMATLNLQIALAKNIYGSLKEAKQKAEGEVSQVSERESEQQQSQRPREQNNNEMIMSFKPAF